MTEPVRIPRAVLNAILREAQRVPGEEVCGLVSGNCHGLQRCYPAANVAADRTRRFEVDAQSQIDTFRDMRERGEELAAIYHSHPDGPALPSSTDIAECQYPDVLYLIVSLRRDGVPEMRGFHIRNGSATEVTLDT
jgi:[CysO sulfur-carrier protein]-S-L-cysteine hydrolase